VFKLNYLNYIIIIFFQRGLTMLPDFQYVLAHPDILTELAAIRGLLRKRYPTLQHGLFLN